MDKDKLVKEIREVLMRAVYMPFIEYDKAAEALVNKGLVFKSSVEVDEDKVKLKVDHYFPDVGWEMSYRLLKTKLIKALSTTDIIK